MSLSKSFGKKNAQELINWIVFGDDEKQKFPIPNEDTF